MTRTYFENLPSTNTPLRAERFNGLLNGEESIEKIVVGDIEGKNLFDKNNVNKLNHCTINSTTKLIETNSSYKMLYIPCLANTTYTISKVESLYLTVGTTETKPQLGVYVNDYIASSDTTRCTVTTNATANYLVLRYYRTTDTITEQQILNSLQIEKGSEVTNYVPYKSFDNSESEIYSENEIKIGRWIDGKPLYRKVIIGTCASAINTTLTLGNISNLKDVAEINANWKANDNYRYFMSNPSESPVVYINASGDVNENHKGTYFNSVSIIVTIKYTKTTD